LLYVWKSKEDDGRDSVATQLFGEDHWKDLVIIIAVVRLTAFILYP
jgi:hypothetical protein